MFLGSHTLSVHLHLTVNIHSQGVQTAGTIKPFSHCKTVTSSRLLRSHFPRTSWSPPQCSGQWGHLALPSDVAQVTSQPCQTQGTAVAASPPCWVTEHGTGTEAGLGQSEQPQQVHKLTSITIKKRIKKNPQNKTQKKNNNKKKTPNQTKPTKKPTNQKKNRKKKNLCSFSSLQSLRSLSARAVLWQGKLIQAQFLFGFIPEKHRNGFYLQRKLKPTSKALAPFGTHLLQEMHLCWGPGILAFPFWYKKDNSSRALGVHTGRNFAVRGPDSTEEQRGLGECDGAVATAGEGQGCGAWTPEITGDNW